MDTAVRVPLSQRINMRMIVFFAVVLGLLAYPMWIFVDTMISGGTWQRRDARGAYTEVYLKWMSDFEMDQVSATNAHIPADRLALNGKRVMFVGEVAPSGRSVAGKRGDFDLVFSVAKCCFGGSIKVQHFIKCDFESGVKKELPDTDTVRVTGKLHVGIEREPQSGAILSVFRLDVEKVEPV